MQTTLEGVPDPNHGMVLDSHVPGTPARYVYSGSGKDLGSQVPLFVQFLMDRYCLDELDAMLVMATRSVSSQLSRCVWDGFFFTFSIYFFSRISCLWSKLIVDYPVGGITRQNTGNSQHIASRHGIGGSQVHIKASAIYLSTTILSSYNVALWAGMLL